MSTGAFLDYPKQEKKLFMNTIINLLKQNHIKSANKTLISTAIELAKYQQSNFNSLDDAVKRIAYHLTLTIYPDIEEYWAEVAEIEKKQKKLKKIAESGKGVMTIEGSNDTEEMPVLAPLTPKQKRLITDFKKVVTDYLKKLPCFTTHLSNEEQKQVISDFDYWIDNHKGTPDKLSERKALLNIQYMAECLINNFNVIKVRNGGVTNLAYWNGETYLTGEVEIDSLIKKVNLLTYNNLYNKDCRKPVTTSDVCSQLEIMADAKDIAPASYIPCLNGIVYLDDNQQDNLTYNLRLLKFTPDIITIYQYQGYYKPVSEIPQEVRNKVDRYFELIANKDRETPQHYQEIKNRIFEFCSTILYRGQLFKSYGFLHGGADAGKSKFLTNCIFSILPANSSGSLRLDKIDSRFELSGIEGKLANLFDEHNLSYGVKGIAQQEALKELVSGNKIRVENKNVKAHDIRNDARLFVALNNYMNVTDDATAKKMVYIPMRGALGNVDASRYYVNENCSQDEKDYIFITLLGYLQQVFKNRAQTGKYFRQSKYIDDLQITAEATTNELMELLQNWLDDTDPLKDYPLGQLLNKDTVKQMRLRTYETMFNTYQKSLPENKQIKVTTGAFKNKLLKLIDFSYWETVKDTSFKDASIRGVLVPKHYRGRYISDYQAYKEQIILVQQATAKSNNIIDLNTDKKYKDIKDQHLTNPICK